MVSSVISPLVLGTIECTTVYSYITIPRGVSSVAYTTSSGIESLPTAGFFVTSLVVGLRSFPYCLRDMVGFFVVSVPYRIEVSSK